MVAATALRCNNERKVLRVPLVHSLINHFRQVRFYHPSLLQVGTPAELARTNVVYSARRSARAATHARAAACSSTPRRARRRRACPFCRVALALGARLLWRDAGGRGRRLRARHARQLRLAWPLVAPRRCRRRVPARVLALLPVPLHLGERSLQRLLVVLLLPAEPAASYRQHEDLPVRSGSPSVECIVQDQRGASGPPAE